MSAEIPRALGRYEIERLLGQGGMGRVLLARDSVLGRRVAVKILRDDLGLPPEHREELFRRMRHEARAAAALSHPNMVTLHDLGEDPEHGIYLVFEYVEGVTLRDRLKQAPVPLSEIPELARALGGALAHAHEAGVIHRDVKPENVLLSRTGPKLADFGIARVPDSTLTGAGAVLGTPSYSAPEALAQGQFSAKSDQFSLAATLYEAVCGQRAFSGSDALVIAGKIASEPPPPLAAVGCEPRIANRLSAVLRRGMAKDAADRYPSCKELGEAVAAALETPLPEIGAVTSLAARAQREIERSPTTRGVEREGSLDLAPRESTRPSIMIRRQTHRLQNIFAAIGLLTIIVLVVIGRKNRDEGEVAKANASASASAMRPPPRSSARHESPRPLLGAAAGRRAVESDASTADADSE